eukprot:gene4184-5235_t
MSENYARVLCKIVVAQICRGFGFTAISQSACDALADIVRLYIEEIGTRAHEYSELSCRTDSNFYDVRQAFNDMSINFNELYHFITQADEIPFGQNQQQLDRPHHIPSFLPDFPDKHTFSKTPLYGEVITDPRVLKKNKNKQKRKIESSLTKISEIESNVLHNQQQQQQNNNGDSSMTDVNDSQQQKDQSNNNNNNINTDIIAPTPLQEISNTFFIKHEDESKKHDEVMPARRALLSEEDNERVKKRIKCERILSLTHDSSNTTTIAEDDKDKDSGGGSGSGSTLDTTSSNNDSSLLDLKKEIL